MHKIYLCLALASGLLLTGCGGSGLPLQEVTGTVTRGGEPLQGVGVQFQPTAGRASFGRTDAQGNYVLEFTRDESGALPGEHRVTLRVPQKQPDEVPGFAEMDLDAQEMALQTRPVPVPDSVVVQDSGDNVFDFEINDLQQ